jgi:deoxyribodipyrimidine photo-lyase
MEEITVCVPVTPSQAVRTAFAPIVKPGKPHTNRTPPAIVWLRQDLRLADNPALVAACRRGGPVVPVFIWAPEEEGIWPSGSASRWWLHQSLEQLGAAFDTAGSELVIRRGSSSIELRRVAEATGAKAVFWNRRYDPSSIARDRKAEEALRAAGLHTESFNAGLLHEPGTIQNKAGRPFQVFTPFWRTCLASTEPGDQLPAPRKLLPPSQRPASLPLMVLGLEPIHNWTEGLRATWHPGSSGAQAELRRFLRDGLLTYTGGRNRPDLVGTSRLSPHLHFGEISPRQVWHAVKRFAESHSIPAVEWRKWQFLTELGWREFAHHLLFHFPHTPEQPLRPAFARFPWRKNSAWLRAWQRGQTGYPLVDAGMRELWSTGWMHNRVRMVVASFLVKNLLIPWQEGARWFWDTLVDADLANNTLGWQWTAGCGADAAPFFRIFNPVSQSEKFDPRGNYVRRWVPEVARLPDAWIHQPWQAPPATLTEAGVELGRTYPRPIVSHLVSREVALEAYRGITR